LGRQAANTKLGPKRVHEVRVRGGNKKYRALRLDAGNFSWGSQNCTRKTRVLTVVYNASNNELVRTNTLVKGAVIQVDATPFRQWYEAHYAKTLSKKKGGEEETEKKSNHVQRKIASRQGDVSADPLLDDQFAAGRLYGMYSDTLYSNIMDSISNINMHRLTAKISSRPGQSGRCDGYLLEGQELEFYVRKLKVCSVVLCSLVWKMHPSNFYINNLIGSQVNNSHFLSISRTIKSSKAFVHF
jgi:small subunit ribosomal protein S8e